MRSVKLDTLKPSHRAGLVTMLDDWRRLVLEAFDRNDSVAVHSHQECRVFGEPELFSEFVFQGWSFGVSSGDYPKQKTSDPRMKRGRPKAEKREVVASGG